jgi:LysM repeat protein
MSPLRLGGLALACALVIAGCGGGGGSKAKSDSTSTTKPAATTTTTLPATRYVVRQGDTLSAIAAKFHVDMSRILALNHLPNADHLTLQQTLLIPPPLPVVLTVTPTSGPPGQQFAIRMTGVKPGETVKFEIDGQGYRFVGSPHLPDAIGLVATTFQPSTSSPGVFTVIGRGNAGSEARSGFTLTAPPATPSPS